MPRQKHLTFVIDTQAGDPDQEAVARTYNVDGRPLGVTIGEGAVWAASAGGTVLRIDPARNLVVPVEVGGTPRAPAVGAGMVWISID